MTDISQNLVEQVESAIADKTPVRIEGGGTKSQLGRSTEHTTVLSTKEHSGVVEYKPVELIMTVRGGTTLAEIDAELDKNNQMLACDPRRFAGNATIGGSLATNQSGHARPWFGSLRDHVLGVKLITGKGEHLRFGGQVMKNVAGYDVSRLQAGAMGAFGVISEVSFKVLPKPEDSASLSLAVEADEAIMIMNKLSGTAKPITAASWLDNQLYVRLEGAKKAVNATSKKWKTEYCFNSISENEAKLFWDNLREHELAFFDEIEKPLWRFSVNAAAKHRLEEEAWLFNWCGSQRWLRGDNLDIQALSELAQDMNGEVHLYSGGNRQAELSLPRNEVIKTLMQNVKQSFDPENIFNQGRLYSWL